MKKTFAFPSNMEYPEYGMTLLDFFATQAMISLVAKYACAESVKKDIAIESYEIAEAMMKEREKRNEVSEV